MDNIVIGRPPPRLKTAITRFWAIKSDYDPAACASSFPEHRATVYKSPVFPAIPEMSKGVESTTCRSYEGSFHCGSNPCREAKSQSWPFLRFLSPPLPFRRDRNPAMCPS